MECFRSNSIMKRMRSFRVIDVVPADEESTIPFAIDAEKLTQLVKSKDTATLIELGGIECVVSALKSNAELGIRGDAMDLSHRRNVFDSNNVRKYGVASCLRVLLRALIDTSSLMAIACAVYLVIVGIMLGGRKDGWKEGAYLLGCFYLFTDLDKVVELGIEVCFRKVKEGGGFVVVVRNGVKQQIPSSEVVVGDIVFVKSGGMVPADGLLLEAIGDQYQLKLDESHLDDTACAVKADASTNPFLHGGAFLEQGQAKMLITAVGESTVSFEKHGARYHHPSIRNFHLQGQVNSFSRNLVNAKWIFVVSYMLVALGLYFSGNSKYEEEFSLFRQRFITASYVVVLIILVSMTIWATVDVDNFSWAMKVSLSCAINDLSRHNVIVRNLLAWEKIGIGAATVNVVYEGNASSGYHQVQASKVLCVPRLSENIEAAFSVSSNIADLIRQGIYLNTTGIAYCTMRAGKHQSSGNPSERTILSQASLQLDMDWKTLNETCRIRKVDSSEVSGRRIVVQVGGIFHVHRRGPAHMILGMCSSFYNASSVLTCLAQDMRNSLEMKLHSINSAGGDAIALAHRLVSEEEWINDPALKENENIYHLLGFIHLEEITGQEEILTRTEEEFRDAGLGFNVITHTDSVNGTGDPARLESHQSQINAIEDGTWIDVACEGEDTMENSTVGDMAFVTKFCLVEELEENEDPSSPTPPVVLEQLKQALGVAHNNGEYNLVSCDDFSKSSIGRTIISWAVEEMNLDKDPSIYVSKKVDPKNHGLGFLLSLENGSIYVHEKGFAESILNKCSSYYSATGKKVIGNAERMLLEQKARGWESSKCPWVAFAHSQDENGDGLWSLLGILILHQLEVNENETPADKVSISDSNSDASAADEVSVSKMRESSSPANRATVVLISMAIEDESSRSSDLVIMDGENSSLKLILRWSSCIIRNSQMFLQFQITTFITILISTYISYVRYSDEYPIDITALPSLLAQLLWINLGMGSVAAVTFGRQKPETPSNYRPVAARGCKRKFYLINGFMLRNILGQVAYQITVMTILEFRGADIFGFNEDVMETMTTVTPIFLQAFNMVNARKIEEKNIFSGMQAGFVCVVLFAAPVVMVEGLHAIGKLMRLSWAQWAICMGMGMGTWLVGFAFKFLPLGWLHKFNVD